VCSSDIQPRAGCGRCASGFGRGRRKEGSGRSGCSHVHRSAGLAGAPLDMAATASPRSFFATTSPKSTCAAAATCSRLMSGSSLGGSSVPVSIIRTLWPRLRSCSATNPCSSPLLSIVPRTTIVAIELGQSCAGIRQLQSISDADTYCLFLSISLGAGASSI